MRTPDEVAAMLRLKTFGWGVRRIARQFGCSHMTVRRYLATGEWVRYSKRSRAKRLDGLSDWLAERFRFHAGNADILRRELQAQRGVTVSLRTVERAVKPLRMQFKSATTRTPCIEAGPGELLQIDFGERRVSIAGQSVRVYLFVATLGYSQRLHARAFRSESQKMWFEGLESAFSAFGGVTAEVLFFYPKALLLQNALATVHPIRFNANLLAFADHWRFYPRLFAARRVRLQGQHNSGVAYVKRNAIAGRGFVSWDALDAHLAAWTRDVADASCDRKTGVTPIERFRREEQAALRPINGIASFARSGRLASRYAVRYGQGEFLTAPNYLADAADSNAADIAAALPAPLHDTNPPPPSSSGAETVQ